jgi:hypothetical protein
MSGRALIASAIAMSGCLPDGDLGSYSGGAAPTTDVGALGMPPGRVEDRAPPPVMQAPGEAAPVANGDGEQPVAPAAFDPGAGTTSFPGAATAPSAKDDDDAPAAEPEPPDTEARSTTDPDLTPDPGPAEPPPTPPSEPVGVRFVRLVADSAVLGPYTSVAEFNVLDGSGNPIDRTGWVASADSEELVWVGGARAGFAIDGDSITMWHTAWFQVVPTSHPHRLDVDLGAFHEVSGFRYLGRQDPSLDGRVANYRFFVSVDGVEWGEPVASGTLENSTAEQEVRFTR